MHQHGGKPGIEAVAAELHDTDGAMAAGVQVGGEVPQDRVGILMRFVNQGGEIASNMVRACCR